MSDEKVDQLNLDAAEARKRGMTYGKYMQMKLIQEGATVPKPKQVPGENEAKCKQCGKIFQRGKYYRVYCSRLCKAKYAAVTERNRKLKGGYGI